MRNYIVTSFFLILPFFLVAQSTWEMGFSLGTTAYQGDLTPERIPESANSDLMYGFFLRKSLNPVWAIRANFLHGTWKGADEFAEDPKKLKRDFSFTNQISEGAILLEWDPFGKSRFREGPYNFRPRITPYGYLGAGLAHYQLSNNFPTVLDGITPEGVAKDLEEAENNLRLAIPMGLGLKMDLSKRSTLAFEGGPHYGVNDLVDGVSNAGNSATNDWYWHASANLSIRFGKKDSDGDGIIDKEDKCRYVAGSLSARGCPDQDGDGVEDDEDVCPTLAGPSRSTPCGCVDKVGDGTSNILRVLCRVIGQSAFKVIKSLLRCVYHITIALVL